MNWYCRFIKISKIHYSNLFYKRLKFKKIRRNSLKPQICLDYFVVQIYYFFKFINYKLAILFRESWCFL